MKNQKGFTAIELILVVSVVAWVAVFCGIVYVLVHFISKFW